MKRNYILIILLCMCAIAKAQNNTLGFALFKLDNDANISQNIVENLNYDKFLNYYGFNQIFIIPSDKAMLKYVDPVSYAMEQSNLWEFHLDASKGQTKQLYADVYKNTFNNNGSWSVNAENSSRIKMVTGGTDNAILKDRVEFIINNSIIFDSYNSSKKYYRTKGNNFLRIEKNGGSYQIYGSLQDNQKRPIKVQDVIETDNGIALIVDEMPLTTYNSVAKTLAANPDFSEFLSIIKECGACLTHNYKDGWQAGDQELGNLFCLKKRGAVGAEDAWSSKEKAIYLLNNYHYTIYAPTNDAMKKAYAAGLPTLKDLRKALDKDEINDVNIDNPESEAAKIMEVMLNFVRYHIQDNAIFADNGSEGGDYLSGKPRFIKATSIDEETGETVWDGEYTPARPYKIKVKDVSANGITIVDAEGAPHNVIIKDGYYNLMANEYWYGSSSTIRNPWEVRINNSSFVVIHAIDSPLLYSKEQFVYKYQPLTFQ